MFKILKEGKLTKTTVIYKDKCKICGCEFEFDDDYITKRDKSFNPDLVYKCPYCGAEITKKYDKIEKQEIVEEVKPEKEKSEPAVPSYPGSILPTTVTYNPCEGCHIYERVKKGEIVVDDSCYWCPKNPYKVVVTCKDSTTTSTTGAKPDPNIKITLEGEAKC